MTAPQFTSFDALAGLVIFVEPTGAIVHWNRATSDLIGCSSDVAPSQPLGAFLAPAEELLVRIRDAVRTQQAIPFEATLIACAAPAARMSRTVAFSLAITKSAEGDGSPLVVLNGVDVTEHASDRLRLERALRDSVAELERAQVVAKVGSWRLDVEHDELVWSDETHRIFGTRAGLPITYERFLSFVHPDDQPHVDAKWKAALRGEPYEIEHRIVVDGSTKWVREKAELEFDEEGRARAGIGVVLDITEEKASVDERRLWGDRLDAIVSPKRPLIGDDVIGKTDFDLLSNAEAQRLFDIKHRVLETGAGTRTTVSTTFESEEQFHDLTVEPLRDLDGQVVGVTCAAWDITEQRRAEATERFLAEAGAVLLGAALDSEEVFRQLGALVVRDVADWFLVEIIEDGRPRRLRIAHSTSADPDVAQRLEQIDLDRKKPYFLFEALEQRKVQIVSSLTDDDIEALSQSRARSTCDCCVL